MSRAHCRFGPSLGFEDAGVELASLAVDFRVPRRPRWYFPLLEGVPGLASTLPALGGDPFAEGDALVSLRDIASTLGRICSTPLGDSGGDVATGGTAGVSTSILTRLGETPSASSSLASLGRLPADGNGLWSPLVTFSELESRLRVGKLSPLLIKRRRGAGTVLMMRSILSFGCGVVETEHDPLFTHSFLFIPHLQSQVNQSDFKTM